MARGDKKNNIDGWRIVGKDALGRPVFKKDIKPQDKSRYKDVAKRALDPMADMRTKVDHDLIDELPVEFTSVFFEDGGKWDDISKDGKTLYGTSYDTGAQVAMSRQGNEIVIAVDDEIVSVIGPAEERELKLQHIEYELGGEQINRNKISTADITTDEKTGVKKVVMTTSEDSTLTYRISPDGKSAVGYITTVDENGNVENREIAQNIPVEDIAELSNEIAGQENKHGSTVATIGQAAMISKYLKKEWRRHSEKDKEELPRLPFSGALSRFFDKALRPLNGI